MQKVAENPFSVTDLEGRKDLSAELVHGSVRRFEGVEIGVAGKVLPIAVVPPPEFALGFVEMEIEGKIKSRVIASESGENEINE